MFDGEKRLLLKIKSFLHHSTSFLPPFPGQNDFQKCTSVSHAWDERMIGPWRAIGSNSFKSKQDRAFTDLICYTWRVALSIAHFLVFRAGKVN